MVTDVLLSDGLVKGQPGDPGDRGAPGPQGPIGMPVLLCTCCHWCCLRRFCFVLSFLLVSRVKTAGTAMDHKDPKVSR